jgi:hypothetical protein
MAVQQIWIRCWIAYSALLIDIDSKSYTYEHVTRDHYEHVKKLVRERRFGETIQYLKKLQTSEKELVRG